MSQKKLKGWKKVRTEVNGKSQYWLVRLEIPADAGRVQPGGPGEKMRCEYAKVLEIYKLGESRNYRRVSQTNRKSLIGRGIVNSAHHPTEYRIGRYVYPHRWDAYQFDACRPGIHFFTTKRQALNY